MATRPRSSHRSKPHPLSREIGERIRRLRKSRGFTFDAFVEETGLGRGYVSELERGLVVPSVRVLDQVARALELTMADLILGNSPRERLFDLTAMMDAEQVATLLRSGTELSGNGSAKGRSGPGKP